MKKYLSISIITALLLMVIPFSVFAAPSQDELDAYLVDLGWTQEELETYLSDYYGLALNDFESVNELKEALGTVLTDENLNELLAQYELTRQQLDDLLAEYGEEVTDYKFYDDLDLALATYTMSDEDLAQLENELQSSLDDLGISEQEVDALLNHLDSINIEDPAFDSKMNDIVSRAEAIGDFESADDLNEEQIAEVVSLWDDVLDLLQLDAKYALVKDGQNKTVTFADLLQMNDPNGYSLSITLFTKDGQKLVDMIMTPELFGSETLKDTEKAVEKVEQIVEKKTEVKTVKGAKLPKTATNYLLYSIVGLMLSLVGVISFRRLYTRGI